jgi:hypothetical protein
MNWHFNFFLFDIVGWVGIALLFTYVFTTKSYKAHSNNGTKISRIIASLVITSFAGLFSVLSQGLPDVGLSTNSFIYAFFGSLCLVFYQQLRIRSNSLNLVKNRQKSSIYKVYKGGEDYGKYK